MSAETTGHSRDPGRRGGRRDSTRGAAVVGEPRAGRKPSRSRSSSSRRSRRCKPGSRSSRPNSAAATRRPGPSKSSCWPPRARSKTRCGSSERKPRKPSTAERSVACGGRRTCQAVRARWRSLARAGVAAPCAGGRRAAHSALAEPVCRRAARRLVHGPHADVSVGWRLRAGPARPARVRRISSVRRTRAAARPARPVRTRPHRRRRQHPAPPAQPKNFGEAIILQMQESQKNQPTDPRLNPAVAMGLNSRSMVRQA